MTLPDHVGLSPDGTKVRILDQSLLPGREVYLELDQLDELIEAIQSLRVRGAPAIGIFAGYALYVLAQRLEKSAVQEELPRLGEALSNAGAQVIYTRQDDSNPSLEQRALTAHRYRADLFISCHQNSAGKNATPHGVQVYYNAPFSQPLAMYVQKQLEPLMGDSQWNYWNGPNASYNFAVTRERQYPSILIEFGFLSNPGDEALALSDGHRRAMADAVVQGVIDYYNAYS